MQYVLTKLYILPNKSLGTRLAQRARMKTYSSYKEPWILHCTTKNNCVSNLLERLMAHRGMEASM